MEQRSHFRLARSAQITCREVAYPLESAPEVGVRMVDVSEGGVRLEAPSAFRPGTLLKVSLALPGWQRHTAGFLRYGEETVAKPLVAVGEVVRSTAAGESYEIGVRFLDIWTDHWNAMRLYLEGERNRP